MSCGVYHRRGLDLALLWRRPAATALIRPLAWESPYAVGAALEKGKGPKTKTKKPPKFREFLLWCSGNESEAYKDRYSIPGLPQWVKDLVLP